jgi:mannobiose 2-epimerase
MIQDECKKELLDRMIPFWSSLIDIKHGGFFGEYDDSPIPTACKGSIYHARILWFFSKCYKQFHTPSLAETAAHAYRFIRDKCIDKNVGGVYWSLDYTGNPLDADKHAYALAFTLYGLSAYYDAFADPEALECAYNIFTCLETKYRTATGYHEQFDVAFNPQVNMKLSETLGTPITMNTLLHIMEAYTEFYNAAKSKRGEIKEALNFVYTILTQKVFCNSKGRMDLFFDEAYHPQSDEKSYGHDIEASWLLTEAARVLGRLETDAKLFLHLADTTLDEGFDGVALINECKNSQKDTDRIWWVQAETVVGLLNAYELTGQDSYTQKAHRVWEYIKESLIAQHEWHWGKTKDGTPFNKPFAGMWKCPYHNGRMFLEVIKKNVNF